MTKEVYLIIHTNLLIKSDIVETKISFMVKYSLKKNYSDLSTSHSIYEES